MPKVVNVADFVKIGVIAFVFIWLVNKTLAKVGAEQYGI